MLPKLPISGSSSCAKRVYETQSQPAVCVATQNVVASSAVQLYLQEGKLWQAESRQLVHARTAGGALLTFLIASVRNLPHSELPCFQRRLQHPTSVINRQSTLLPVKSSILLNGETKASSRAEGGILKEEFALMEACWFILVLLSARQGLCSASRSSGGLRRSGSAAASQRRPCKLPFSYVLRHRNCMHRGNKTAKPTQQASELRHTFLTIRFQVTWVLRRFAAEGLHSCLTLYMTHCYLVRCRQ